MIYTILITAHPDMSEVNHRALSYCEAVVARGDQIKQVFFMHDANYIAIHPSAQQWSTFAAGHGIDLQTCISTAEQKSIQARDYAAGFQKGGLSALADSILSTDATVQFNEEEGEFEFESKKNDPTIKKNNIVFVFQSSPEELALGSEGIDLLLVLSAFEAEVKVVFVGRGIDNVLTSHLAKPRYAKRFKALEDFDVDDVFVMADNVIDADIKYELLSEAEFKQIVSQSHVLQF